MINIDIITKDPIVTTAIIAVGGHLLLKIIDVFRNRRFESKKEEIRLTNKIFESAKETIKKNEKTLFNFLEKYLVDIPHIEQTQWIISEVYSLCHREAKRVLYYNKKHVNYSDFFPDLYTTLPRVYIQMLYNPCDEESVLHAVTCKLFIKSLLEEEHSLIARSCDVVILSYDEFIERGKKDPNFQITLLREGIVLPEQSTLLNIEKLEKLLKTCKEIQKLEELKEELKEGKEVKEIMKYDVLEKLDEIIEDEHNRLVERVVKPLLKPYLKLFKSLKKKTGTVKECWRKLPKK